MNHSAPTVPTNPNVDRAIAKIDAANTDAELTSAIIWIQDRDWPNVTQEDNDRLRVAFNAALERARAHR